MIIKLGIISGEILSLLDEIKEPFSINDVKLKLDYLDDHILMSIGWLVREGHIHVVNSNNEYYICCCKDDSVHCP